MAGVLDVRRLLMLREVARRGSLAAAARELGYTQPAISHHIRRLETEAGVRLVSRDGRGVSLTDAGRALVAHADAIAADLATAQAELDAITRAAAGRVRLAALPSSNATLVPAALTDLASQGIDLAVSLVEAGPDDAYALLQRAECDLAITFDHPTLPAPAGLAITPLLDDQLFVVLPAGHPLAGADEIDLARLSNEPWIISERCREQTLHACALAGFAPTVALATDDYQHAVPRLVAARVGVSITTACITGTADPPGVTIVPVAGIAPRRIIAVHPNHPRPSPAVSALLAALQRAARPRQTTPSVHGRPP
jgi:molybdate transport repressor ModE-like protein